MFLFRFRLLLTLLVLIVLSGCTDNKTVPNPLMTIPEGGTNRVMIGDNFFQPVSLMVPVGTTVHWDQRGYNQHTVTDGVLGQANAGKMFDSGTLNPGRSFQVTFKQAGTIQYFCRFHGSMGMTGTIIVR